MAEKAGVAIVTVNQFEAGKSASRRATVEVIRLALEAAGLSFLDADSNGGPGVRLRQADPTPGGA